MTTQNDALLVAAKASVSRVELTLRCCLFSCCGGGWMQRKGRATYSGMITTLECGFVIIQDAPLGRVQQVMVALPDLISVDVLTPA